MREEIMTTNNRAMDKLIIMQNKRRLHYPLSTKEFNAFVFLDFI